MTTISSSPVSAQPSRAQVKFATDQATKADQDTKDQANQIATQRTAVSSGKSSPAGAGLVNIVV